jgi:cell division septation protein DedD
VRYEALFVAAFVAGLGGAISQQGVKPPVNHVETASAQQSIAIPIAPVPASAPLAAGPQVSDAAPATAEPAKTVPSAPVKHAHAKPKKLAAKPQPKPVVAEAEPPHSFWYRLFHKSGDDRVAEASR